MADRPIKQKRPTVNDARHEALAQAAADPEIVDEVKALIHAANVHAAHILQNGNPDQKAAIMRMIFSHTVKEVLSPKHSERDEKQQEMTAKLDEFHDVRRSMIPLEELE
jgi:hypothetical protein